MSKNLPERKLNRLNKRDYSRDGFYFVTICVKYRVKFLGAVVDGKMVLNEYGKIIEQQWQWMEKQYPWINLDEYIIMPNHIHGVIYINRGAQCMDGFPCRDNPRVVPTTTKQKLYNRQKNLLSKSICAFKTTSSKMIREINDYGFCWQRSFHDRIIRNEQELNRIRKYIRQNSDKWGRDRNNQGIFM